MRTSRLRELNTTTLDSTASLARAQTTEPSPPRPQSQHGIRDEPLTRPRSFRDAVLARPGGAQLATFCPLRSTDQQRAVRLATGR